MVLVVEVSVVICQVVPQAGARGGRVTAAEGNAVQQVTAIHVTPDTTGGGNRLGKDGNGRRVRGEINKEVKASIHT